MRRSIVLWTCFVLMALAVVPALSPRVAASGGFVPMEEWKQELLGLAFPASPDPEDGGGEGGAPVVGPNVRVTGPQSLFPAGLLGRGETTIAGVEGGRFLVAGWNDAEGFLRAPFFAFGACPSANPVCAPAPGVSGYAFSTNGGEAWTDGGAPFVAGVDPANPTCGNIVSRGDPWLDSGGDDGSASVFYANLAVHETPITDPCFIGTFFSSAGVSVHRGHFFKLGGVTTFAWDDVRLLQPVAGVGASVGFPLDFYDKEALATDKDRDHVFVSVTNFIGRSPNILGCGFGQIELWHSFDGGNTWTSPPTLVQADQVSPTDCGTGRLNTGSDLAVAPNGDVHVVWQSGPDFLSGATVVPLSVKIMESRCKNFGAGPCTAPVVVDAINSMRLSPPQGYNRNRMNDFPRIAIDLDGSHEGRIYVVYPSGTGTPVAPSVFPDSNILLKFSDNRGKTWSSAVNVNPPGDGRKDFWPVVTVDENGDVNVVYQSSDEANLTPSTTDIECNPGAKQAGGGVAQNGRRSSLVDVFLARSETGGTGFGGPTKVTDVTSNWCKARTNVRPTFGDYIDARSFEERLAVVWSDARLAAPAADALAPPAGPRTQESDVFYATVDLDE